MQQEAEQEKAWKERWDMRECDREVHRDIPVAHMPRQSNRTPDGLRFVSDIGEAFYTREDANASLQKSDPENYGPYLQEGEKSIP